ncbi:MAG: anaerobic glycerol-3-phosphate dehydrogenase subunit C, partial [Bacteroidales bacterium]|nr:anaerobic glycerol-3-phosphate dehydrogenase subunit C [Bacteroidales bacterium]
MNMQEKNISANNFEQCIKCTVCTVYCPVVPVNPLYPGPKQAGPDGERLRLKKGIYFDDTLKYCMNCKRCEVACPSGVRIGDIIQAARLKYNTQPPKLRDMILASTDLMGSIATKAAPIVNMTVGMKPVKAAMDGVLGIDKHRTFPKYSSRTFEKWFNKNVKAFQESFNRHVSFFHGCFVNYNYPQLGKDLVSVMNSIGYGVHLLDKEKCCGVALISNGMTDRARKNAAINLESIRKSVNERQMPVIGTSSTCSFTLRDEYPHLLGINNEDVRDYIELASRFIYRIVDEGKVKLVFKKDYKARIAYHTPCHMEKLGWGIFSTELLRMIPGAEVTVLE